MITVKLDGITITLSPEAASTIKKVALALLTGIGSTQPGPVTPVPLPTTDPLPEGFDERVYLATYTDVANAVRAGYFTSGADHYIKHGRAEGREYRQKPGVPVDPTPAKWVPADYYDSISKARQDFAAHPEFDTVILIDGHSGFADGVARFGPAINYYVQRSGSVTRTKPVDDVSVEVPIN